METYLVLKRLEEWYEETHLASVRRDWPGASMPERALSSSPYLASVSFMHSTKHKSRCISYLDSERLI